jgi:predicted transcriptional regulator
MGLSEKKPHRRHKIVFQSLKNSLDQFNVKAIMTSREDFFFCQPHQEVSDAARLLKERKFSGAPLEENVITRYVKLEQLEKCHGCFRHCVEVASEIPKKWTVSDSTTIESLIAILADKDCPVPLFVADNRKSIVGLVTGADLDKIGAKTYFFVLISALESLLLGIIGPKYDKYRYYLQNPERITRRYKRCQGNLVGLDEYNYLMTSEILEIVCNSEIGKTMNLTQEERKELEQFRNKVAHGNYLIVQDGDIDKLKKMKDKIQGYINTLSNFKIDC